MNKFLLEIITPKGVYLKDEVNELYLNTSNGYMGIMAKHDTLITGVEISPMFIVKDNKKVYYVTFKGVLNVKPDLVRLIVSNIEESKDIDINRAKKAKERAMERLKNRKEGIDLERASLALKRANARISCINKDFI